LDDPITAWKGFVTLPCSEREVSAVQELSGRHDCGPPRVQGKRLDLIEPCPNDVPIVTAAGRATMDVAFVSAISALAGSVIGGLTSGYTTWLTQRSQARAGQVAHDLARREDLIRDFIIAASKMYGDAMVNSEPKMPEIVDLYAMVSRMRVLTMPRSVMCAEKVMGSIIDTYFAPNRTVADLREIVKTGQGVDPLKDFSEAAREELHAFAPI
jgi:hypothetical protein